MLHLLQANIFATQLVAQDNTCTRYAHVLQHVFYIYCKRALLLHNCCAGQYMQRYPHVLQYVFYIYFKRALLLRNCCAGQQLLYMLMQTETIATQFLRCTTPYLACRATICTGGNRVFLPHGQSNSYLRLSFALLALFTHHGAKRAGLSHSRIAGAGAE